MRIVFVWNIYFKVSEIRVTYSDLFLKYTKIRVSYSIFIKTPCWMGLLTTGLESMRFCSAVAEKFPSTETRGRSLQASGKALSSEVLRIVNWINTWGRIQQDCTQVVFQADKSVWNILFTQGHKRLNELTQSWLNNCGTTKCSQSLN